MSLVHIPVTKGTRMDDWTVKTVTLQQIDIARSSWTRELIHLSDWSGVPGGDAQTIHDIAVQINDRRAHSLDLLEAESELRRKMPNARPDDVSTDVEIARWLGEPASPSPEDEIIAHSHFLFARLYRLVVAIPPETLQDPQAFPSLGGESLANAICSSHLFERLAPDFEPSVESVTTVPAWVLEGLSASSS
jgi:hypothetical protein